MFGHKKTYSKKQLAEMGFTVADKAYLPRTVTPEAFELIGLNISCFYHPVLENGVHVLHSARLANKPEQAVDKLITPNPVETIAPAVAHTAKSLAVGDKIVFVGKEGDPCQIASVARKWAKTSCGKNVDLCKPETFTLIL